MNVIKNIREIERLYFDEVKSHEVTKLATQELDAKYQALKSICYDIVDFENTSRISKNENIKRLLDFLKSE